MTKMISFRVTDDEFQLFCDLAKEQNRTLSSYVKNLVRHDAYKAGARTMSSVVKLNPGSTTTTTAMQSRPSTTPKPNPAIDALFREDSGYLEDGTNPPPDEAVA